MGPEKRQLKILVDAQLASAFKTACEVSGTSMTKELSAYMAGRAGLVIKSPPLQECAFRTETRRDRRRAIKGIVMKLTAIRDAEEAYCYRIPESLTNGPAFEDAGSAVDTMDDAIALLIEAYR
jgi:hypothetical protein